VVEVDIRPRHPGLELRLDVRPEHGQRAADELRNGILFLDALRLECTPQRRGQAAPSAVLRILVGSLVVPGSGPRREPSASACRPGSLQPFPAAASPVIRAESSATIPDSRPATPCEQPVAYRGSWHSPAWSLLSPCRDSEPTTSCAGCARSADCRRISDDGVSRSLACLSASA
jgi:hypothetical protein